MSAQPLRFLGLHLLPATIGKIALWAAALAVGLVAYGAWVRASGSGLGCPDWPLCNGQVIPTNRAAAIESGHRWYAMVTLLTVLAAAIGGHKLRKEFPRAGALLVSAAVLTVSQALLGAAVVLTELHPLVRLVHLSVAMAIIGVLTVAGIALVQGRDPSFALRRAAWHLLPTSAAVILLGGAIVAAAVSFECNGLPLCDGASSTLANGLHSAHRTLGAVLFLASAFYALRSWSRGQRDALSKVSLVVAVLLLAQLGLGISIVTERLPVGLRVLHLGFAAAIWWGVSAMWALAAQPPVAAPLSTSQKRPR